MSIDNLCSHFLKTRTVLLHDDQWYCLRYFCLLQTCLCLMPFSTLLHAQKINLHLRVKLLPTFTLSSSHYNVTNEILDQINCICPSPCKLLCIVYWTDQYVYPVCNSFKLSYYVTDMHACCFSNILKSWFYILHYLSKWIC